MTSARIRANRRNAKKSTGPRSRAGRARVAKNALRHGLAAPVSADPALAAAAQRMAFDIAGRKGGPLRLAAARKIAEAQLDVLRIRRARCRLLADKGARVKPPPFGTVLKAWAFIQDFVGVPDSIGVDAATQAKAEQSAAILEAFNGDPRKAPPLEQALDIVAAALKPLERYERRALSRLRTAIRAFDLLGPDD